MFIFVDVEHEYDIKNHCSALDIKNCSLALVSKIQEATFMYSAF